MQILSENFSHEKNLQNCKAIFGQNRCISAFCPNLRDGAKICKNDLFSQKDNLSPF